MSHRIRRAALIAIAILAATGCDVGADDDGLPPDPGEPGRATLSGIDADGDGVRDDVQRTVATRYPEGPVRDALFDAARAGQDALLRAAAGADASDERRRLRGAIACAAAADAGPDAFATLEAVLVNTPERTRAYFALNGQASGTVSLVTSDQETCAGAQSAPAERRAGPDRDRAVVFFANGMFTHEVDAILNTQALMTALQRRDDVFDDHDVVGAYAYNQNEAWHRQVWEVNGQSLSDSWGAFAEFLRGFRDGDARDDQLLQRSAEASMADVWNNEADVASHVQAYESYLDQGYKVVIVAHSQGNFYANEACRRLRHPSLAVVSVASPAATVCDASGPVTTLQEDAVINAVRAFTNRPVLSSTMRNDSPHRTLKSHAFVADYLDGVTSGRRILDHIADAIDRLPPPDAAVGSGPISITLRWGNQPDVDLHVFEPDGTHVFYANPLGLSGELDRDDTDGQGPENYFVPAERLQEGVYWVGVNYYFGTLPETARVQVTAGGTSYPAVTRTLTVSQGADGNASPVPVAEIEVRRYGSGVLYSVREVHTGPPTVRSPLPRASLSKAGEAVGHGPPSRPRLVPEHP
ncbi:YfaP family protein [Rubrivirga sp. IMCC43871]|uniref:YfaP family protein n=1 Tax=Rubrivirga sp. IMCC43871 TaxID=3391575 RepID=UPI00398FA662